MSEFLTDLIIREAEGDKWRLLQDLIYDSDLFEGKIKVPFGFVTDLASVPRIPIIYALYGDRVHRESVIHDYLYATGIVDRKTADRVFREAMKSRKKSWFIRKCMYLGVRWFGKFAYNGEDK